MAAGTEGAGPGSPTSRVTLRPHVVEVNGAWSPVDDRAPVLYTLSEPAFGTPVPRERENRGGIGGGRPPSRIVSPAGPSGRIDVPDRLERDRAQRERLLAAASAGLATGRFDIRSVASSADLSISTLYRHFGSKDALVEQALRHGVEQWRSTVERFSAGHADADGLEALAAFYLLIVCTKRASPELFGALWNADSHAGREVMEAVRALHGSVVVELLERVGIRLDDRVAELFLPAAAAMLERATTVQALLRDPEDDRELTARLARGVVAAAREMADTQPLARPAAGAR